MDKVLKCGNVVKCTKHQYLMLVREVKGDIVICNYFIDSTPIQEEHNINDLKFIKD